MKKIHCLLLLILPMFANGSDYLIDTQGAHASIQFRVKHLGYSWLTGRFNEFSGRFSYDKNEPESASIAVTINTDSIDSNHSKRDKHLRGNDFLAVNRYPEAKFISANVQKITDNQLLVSGTLTLHGVSKAIDIKVDKIGEGADPWGNYRAGFSGYTSFALADFGIDYDLGPASKMVELDLHIEGIRQ